MGTVSVSLPSDGTTADVADYNTPITTLVDEFNGNIDNANIKSGAAIATSKLADDGGISSGKLATGTPVQLVSTNYASVVTGTTTIPYDDSIPQSTEGTEFMTQTITPKSSTNRLSIEVIATLSPSTAATMTVALFQDSGTAAIAATSSYMLTSSASVSHSLRHDMVAGTTSATTFKIRVGGDVASTITMNGASGTRKYGGITVSNIRIIEYKA